MRSDLTDGMLSTIREIFSARMPHKIELVTHLAAGDITRPERQEILNIIAAELCEKGLDADSEPTAYGLTLERLMDVLNRPNLA